MEMTNLLQLKAKKSKDAVQKAGTANCQQVVQSFPTYLLDASNAMLGIIMERAFKSVAPQALVTLFWVLERQQIEIVLQNKLAQDLDAVHAGLIDAMQTKLVDYTSSLKVRRLISIFTYLWDMATHKLSSIN